MRRKKHFAFWVFASLLAAGATLWFVSGCVKQAAKFPSGRALPYEVLYDQMGPIIDIKVPSSVDDVQLRATLAAVADKHQDDPARDYMAAEYLRVAAYLERNGKLSTIPAGSIRRYVPPRNPESRKYMRLESDVYTVNLKEARLTLP